MQSDVHKPFVVGRCVAGDDCRAMVRSWWSDWSGEVRAASAVLMRIMASLWRGCWY